MFQRQKILHKISHDCSTFIKAVEISTPDASIISAFCGTGVFAEEASQQHFC